MLKNKIFAGVLAVMMMAPFSTGLLSFAAEEKTLADYTFEELLAMEKDELCALVENGDVLYNEAEELYQNYHDNFLITIVPVDGEAYLDIPEGEVVLSFNIPNVVADDINSCYNVVLDDGEEYLAYDVLINLNAYADYSEMDVFITTYMMLSTDPDIIDVFVAHSIIGDDTTTAPAETTVPVETTTEAAAETTTETIAETTTAIETAETTASAESTAAGTTTTGSVSGGTSSPKTGDGSAAAVLAGCAAALAGCLLCRKRR